jgi:hypothetical protein
MSEFNIEEKANAYDLALNKAKTLLSKCKRVSDKASMIYRAEDIENIFPELQKPEEERIKDALIELIKCNERSGYTLLNNVSISSMLAWLEKQREQKPYSQMEKCINCQFNMTGYCNGTCILKNKVEPKFKVGDWIIFNGLILYIKEIVQGYYRTISKGGIINSYDWNIDNVARLWTINEAKDGDILRLGDVIAIFKKYIGQEKCICYCSFCEDGNGFEIPIENGENNVYGCTNTTPATQKERVLLFQKMKEAGYTWDPDKKELIKL